MKRLANRFHPLYGRWLTMRSRCNNPKVRDYRHYGGRGIRVCDAWADFWQYVKDMGPRPTSKHTVERINNDGNYEPGNVRWATRFEQAQNMRKNVRVTIDGETLTMAEWGRRKGVHQSFFNTRIDNGWAPEEAITTPNLGKGKRKR